jgi:hypothetical protein
LAAGQGRADIVRLLIRGHGLSAGIGDDLRETPLHEAARGGQAEIARSLIEAGADPAAPGTRHHTPLHAAASAGHAVVARLIIWTWAYVDSMTIGTRATPLHAAVGGGHAEVARSLLERGADPGARTVEGNIPRALAERWGHAEPDLIRSLAEAEQRAVKPGAAVGRAEEKSRNAVTEEGEPDAHLPEPIATGEIEAEPGEDARMKDGIEQHVPISTEAPPGRKEASVAREHAA